MGKNKYLKLFVFMGFFFANVSNLNIIDMHYLNVEVFANEGLRQMQIIGLLVEKNAFVVNMKIERIQRSLVITGKKTIFPSKKGSLFFVLNFVLKDNIDSVIFKADKEELLLWQKGNMEITKKLNAKYGAAEYINEAIKSAFLKNKNKLDIDLNID